MFIVWGTRRTVRKLGYVADFCPICRDTREFKLSRVGLASHVYYVSFGQGKLTGHIIECCECGQALKADPTIYAAHLQQPRGEIGSLISETYPGLRKVYADRLALEEKVRRSPGSLSKEERRQLIIEPFSLLNPAVETLYGGRTQMDKQSGIGCLATIVGGIIIVVISTRYRDPMQLNLLGAAAIWGVLGAAYTLIQGGFTPRRFMRAKTLPALVRALEPLKPTEEDLASALGRCKTSGMMIGKKLKLETIQAELQKRALPDFQG